MSNTYCCTALETVVDIVDWHEPIKIADDETLFIELPNESRWRLYYCPFCGKGLKNDGDLSNASSL